ncbi:MAG: barstar family protein [Succiniclasticum sp.]|jgi:ribonuclease inhibitor|nr:barstar family protein [Succiniclasticum sp.]MDY6302894.1 barstar family protein [Succiniclasticum sp.]MDY6346267.1 barstar family protein [Succiniclasticum sp.]
MKRIVLDSARFHDRKEAHRYLKEQFHFPVYYGENLDALHDCLGEIAEPVEVIVPECIVEDTYLGDYGAVLLQIFLDTAGENPNLKVLVG